MSGFTQCLPTKLAFQIIFKWLLVDIIIIIILITSSYIKSVPWIHFGKLCMYLYHVKTQVFRPLFWGYKKMSWVHQGSLGCFVNRATEAGLWHSGPTQVISTVYILALWHFTGSPQWDQDWGEQGTTKIIEKCLRPQVHPHISVSLQQKVCKNLVCRKLDYSVTCLGKPF